MGTIRCPEMSVRNYHYMLRNIPEEGRYHHKIPPSSGLNIPYLTPRMKTQSLSVYYSTQPNVSEDFKRRHPICYQKKVVPSFAPSRQTEGNSVF